MQLGTADRPCRVVLIDDEPTVRMIVRRILEPAGAEITEAANGVEGLHTIQRLLAEPRGAPDLVITDLMMPRLSGYEVADVLAVVCPTLPVLCLSGYPPSEERMIGGTPDRRLQMIQKPFEPPELLRAARATIARKQVAPRFTEEQREVARRLWEAIAGEVPAPGTAHAKLVDLVKAVEELRRLV
jgi:two-component system alkaline phosphatase synthesis response regulator PhoP